ncbi:MAG: methyltransferase [Duncaniella sp.]|nr:methyltransferase [Duncaniella sp.]
MFDFKQFSIDDSHCDMKVGTDGVLLGSWVNVENVHKVLDAGGGSGLIALMIAQRAHDAEVDCVEISADACGDALKNIAATPFSQRVRVINADITEHRFTENNYDLIVSNPPYFTEALQSPEAGRATSRHEGVFGVEWLVKHSTDLLAPNGTLAFIAPTSRDGEIEFLIELNRLHIMRRCKVIPVEGQPAKRTLWQISLKRLRPTENTTIVIRDRNRNLTPQYSMLTYEFYL